MPLARAARCGRVMITDPPFGSMRNDTRRARLLRRHMTGAGPPGSVTNSKESLSIALRMTTHTLNGNPPFA